MSIGIKVPTARVHEVIDALDNAHIGWDIWDPEVLMNPDRAADFIEIECMDRAQEAQFKEVCNKILKPSVRNEA